MLPDRVSNSGPRLTSQVPYRLRYAALLVTTEHGMKIKDNFTCFLRSDSLNVWSKSSRDMVP